MTTKNFYITLVIIMTIVTGCAKTPASAPAPSIQVRFSAEGLKYIKMTPLKYFIYKDSANRTTDSVVVTVSLLIDEYVRPSSSYYSLFNGGSGVSVNYNGYNTQYFTLMLTKKNQVTDSTWLTGKGVVDIFKPSYSTDDGPIVLYDSNWKQLFKYPICRCPEHVFLSSLVVEGKTYYDIIKSTDPLNWRTIYWAKDIGIIRMEINFRNKNTYTLLRHN